MSNSQPEDITFLFINVLSLISFKFLLMNLTCFIIQMFFSQISSTCPLMRWKIDRTLFSFKKMNCLLVSWVRIIGLTKQPEHGYPDMTRSLGSMWCDAIEEIWSFVDSFWQCLHTFSILVLQSVSYKKCHLKEDIFFHFFLFQCCVSGASPRKVNCCLARCLFRISAHAFSGR